ncbi:TIGR02597 family protein [Kiritimatiella glycovorans]|uniref:Uncharacterized protein n=1 Tax=Kiritimatiella glycovorans TaxID=1307763 RepID=A0A0G3EG82_9BACT|nr:TIGR02597 family protein [Kiritimatiella glycovorans]AKJ65471.1 hypothetical protein L21SP4_02244 [Kiritimatiella glycovorans]
MSTKKHMMTAAAALLLSAPVVLAGEWVGYNATTIPAGADVMVSVPFSQDYALETTVDTKTATGVTVSDTLTAGDYADDYYIRMTSGTGEGLWTTISDNGTDGFTMENTNVLTHISAGDAFQVIPHHTVASLFPESHFGISYTNDVSLKFYNSATVGVDDAPSDTVSYDAFGGNWNTPATIVPPLTQMIIRNGSGEELTFACAGDVPQVKAAFIVAAGVEDDYHIGSGFPVDVTAASVSANTGRSLKLYDNGATGQNKPPAESVSYNAFTGDWNTPGKTLDEGEGFVLRTGSGEVGGLVTVQKPY